MTAPTAILLVPTEAGAALLDWDPDGDVLLRGNVMWYVARPPRVVLPDGRRALPLWQDGAVHAEGWDRARRACAELPRDQRPTGPLWGWLHDFRPTCDDALVLARFLEAAALCRVVLLDLVDGQLRERAP